MDGAELQDLRNRYHANYEDAYNCVAVLEALIEDANYREARRVYEAWPPYCPQPAALLDAGSRIYTACGDPLRAVRLRQLARRSMVPLVDASRHPSRFLHQTVEVSERHLSVVKNQGVAFEPAIGQERPTLKLHDVVGLATVKQNLTEAITQTRSVKSDGGWLGGILFYGPPNCGKHFAARVIAGELDAALCTVNVGAATNPSDIVKPLEAALQSGERLVIFLEHLDAVPGHVDQHAGSLLTQLVPLLDAVGSTGSVILGSAVNPWSVSPLIARPGRLCHALLVLPPDAPARRIFLTQRLAEDAGAEREVEWLVDHTEGYSFGDLDALITAAHADEDGGDSLTHVALRHARQASAPTSAEWLTSAGHHALMNEASGLYDDLLAYFRSREKF